MAKVLKSINAIKMAKFTGVMYGLFSLIFLVFGLIMFFLSSDDNKSKTSLYLMLIPVLLYPLLGFIGGWIMAKLYNFLAKHIGGIEFEVEDKGN